MKLRTHQASRFHLIFSSCNECHTSTLIWKYVHKDYKSRIYLKTRNSGIIWEKRIEIFWCRYLIAMVLIRLCMSLPELGLFKRILGKLVIDLDMEKPEIGFNNCSSTSEGHWCKGTGYLDENQAIGVCRGGRPKQPRFTHSLMGQKIHLAFA